MEDSLFAYTLSQTAEGWSWRLWDEVGEVVAAGEAPDQHSAQESMRQAFARAQGQASPPQQRSTIPAAARRRGRATRAVPGGQTLTLAERWRSRFQAEA